MRICVCVSGQLRGDIDNLVTIKESLEKHHDVDFIFSLWKKGGSKVDGALGHSQIFRIFEPDLATVIPRNFYGYNLWNKLPNTKIKIDTEIDRNIDKIVKSIFPTSIIDIEEENLHLEFPYNCGDKNSIKMLYKRWRCNEIKKNIEKKTYPYDVVLVLRPDLILDFPEKLLPIKDGVILCPKRCDENYVNDVYAMGSSKTIDKYCQLFSKSISQDKWLGIHVELSKLSQTHNITFTTKHNVINNGLKKNKLVTFDDVKEDSKFIKKLINGDVKLEELTIYEKESYFLYKMQKSTENSEKLSNLIRSDISTRLFKNITDDRNRFFFNTFSALVKESDKFYPNAKKLSLINSFVLNETATENIDYFLKNKNLIHSHTEKIIHKAYSKKKVSLIKENISPTNIPDKCADILRDWALSLEKKDLENALYLINLAKIARPTGNYIKNIHERMETNYEKAHH